MNRLVALTSVAVLVAVSCGSGESIITDPSGAQNQGAVASAATKGSRIHLGTSRPSTATSEKRNAMPSTTAALLDTLPDCPTEALPLPAGRSS